MKNKITNVNENQGQMNMFNYERFRTNPRQFIDRKNSEKLLSTNSKKRSFWGEKLAATIFAGLFATAASASNWILINVGDVSTLIPHPSLEAFSIDENQSGNLKVNLGDTTNTQGFYYQQVEFVNGVEVKGDWQCQDSTFVKANGNFLIVEDSFSGEYKFNVKACMTGNGCDLEAFKSDSLICSEGETSDSVQFSGELDTGPVQTMSLFQEELSSSTEGSATFNGLVSGEFRVSESGAATYTLPIEVPVGTAGVQPSIALSYNSQGGDGLVGRGWNVNGTTSIGRCAKSLAIDGYHSAVSGTQNDRLCYNGTRLLPILDEQEEAQTEAEKDLAYWNAERYVSELADFAIFYKVNENAFVMETKAGEQHLFGDVNSISNTKSDSLGIKFLPSKFKKRNSDDSSYVIDDSTDGIIKGFEESGSPVMHWKLKAIKDNFQNYIYYSYDEVEGFLSQVDYTGKLAHGSQSATDPYAIVKLNYKGTLNPRVGYRYGRLFSMTKILESIQVKVDGESYRYYDLSYIEPEYAEQFYYLEQISECIENPSDNGPNNSCKLPLQFSWTIPSIDVETTCVTIPRDDNHKSCSSTSDAFQGFRPSHQSLDENFDNLKIFDMTGDGVADFVYTKNDYWKIRRGPHFSNEESLVDGYAGEGAEFANKAITTDYNGDGVRDLMYALSDGSQWYVLTYAKHTKIKQSGKCQSIDESSIGLACREYESNRIETGISAHSLSRGTLSVDINGDTLEDILEVRQNGLFITLNSYDKGSNSTQFIPSNASNNDDSLIDLAVNQDIGDFINDRGRPWLLGDMSTSALDFNGDGITDVAVKINTNLQYCEGLTPEYEGDIQPRWERAQDLDTFEKCAEADNGNHQFFTDTRWRSELQNSHWNIYLGQNTGTTYSLSPSIMQLPAYVDDVMFGDLNGDGLSDLLYETGNGSWKYQISTGLTFLDQQTTPFTSTEDSKHLLQFTDLNSDGILDVVVPNGDESDVVKQYITKPDPDNLTQVTFVFRGNYDLDETNAPVRFAEVTGDNQLDMLQYSDEKWKVHEGYYSRQPLNLINTFKNGLGVKTQVNYQLMKSSSVYRDEYTEYLDTGNYTYNVDGVEDYHLFSPVSAQYLVSSAISDVNVGKAAEVRYQYSGALMNKVGRGNLGFRSLKTIDMGTCEENEYSETVYNQQTNSNYEIQYIKYENCVETETFYSQEYPFIGMPEKTEKTKGGLLISRAENVLNYKLTEHESIFPFIEASVESSSMIHSDMTSSSSTGYTKSIFTYDNYGNLITSNVLSSDSVNLVSSVDSVVPGLDSFSNVTSVVTENEYGNITNYPYSNLTDDQELSIRKGRLTNTKVKKVRRRNSENAPESVKTSSFSYFPASSTDASKPPLMLESETIYPDDTAAELVTSYLYDDWGNKVLTTVHSRDLKAPLKSSSAFDTRGRFVVSQTNPIGEVTTYVYNDAPGTAPTGIINTKKVIVDNGMTTITEIDDWGKSEGTTAFDIDGNAMFGGAATVSITLLCDIVECPEAATYAENSLSPGGVEKLIYYDAWGREVRTSTQTISGWSHIDTEYNEFGLPYKVSEPYFGTTPPSDGWNVSYYDLLRRPYKTEQAAGGETTILYGGLTTSEENAIGQITTSVKDFDGNLVEVIDNNDKSLLYFYDSNSALTEVKVQIADGTHVTQVVNTYNKYGKKESMTDLDKGFWQYKYDSLGRMYEQIDANNNIVETFYDDYGRKIARLDPENLVCWYYGDNSATSTYSKNKLVKLVQFKNTSLECEGNKNSQKIYYSEEYEYGSNGKVVNAHTYFEGETYTTNTRYDDYQRIRNVSYQNFDFGLRYEYENGYLTKTINNSYGQDGFGDQLVTVQAVNARGHKVLVEYANGVVEDRAFNKTNGLADEFKVNQLSQNWNILQDYRFDEIGTLEYRKNTLFSNNVTRNIEEDFGYDNLNRLEYRTVTSSDFQLSDVKDTNESIYKITESFTYDDLGNIETKTGVNGAYKYDHASAHNRLTKIGNGPEFQYDNNGNIEYDGTRKHYYTPFDKPYFIGNVTSKVAAQFEYGPSRQVLKKTSGKTNSNLLTSSSPTLDDPETITTYLGGLEKVENLDTNVTEHKFYVGNVVITRRSNNTEDTYFLHKDHLGSTVAVSDGSGKLIQQFIYDAFGKQYQVATEFDGYLPYSPAIDRGYTGHKMLNELDIIHMNGRIYDPTLGRFLQADPHIQAPMNSQNYNRYSYVLNNPMSYTDPSGYFFKALGKFVKKHWKVAATLAVAYFTAGAASSWVTSWGGSWATAATATSAASLTVSGAAMAGAITGATAGFFGGYIQTGSLRAAAKGAFAGAIAGAAGGYANFGSVGGFGDAARRVGIAALGGCGAGKASGGSCSKGARLAAIAQAVSMGIEKFSRSKPTMKTPFEKSGTYKPSEEYVSDKTYCVECDVANPDANNIGLGVRSTDPSQVVGAPTPDAGWGSFAEGSVASRGLAHIPGFNSGAVFHDTLVGAMERGIGMHNWGSGWQIAGGLITNQATILPAIALNYIGLGVESYAYYYNNVSE